MERLVKNLCDLLKDFELLMSSNTPLSTKESPIYNISQKKLSKIEKNKLSVISLYAKVISKIQELESYSICKITFEKDEVFSDASKLAGYWGTFNWFLQHTLSNCTSIKRKKVIIDTDCVIKNLQEFREKFQATKFNFTGTARLLGVKLQCKEIILPDSMSLYRLTQKESDDRDALHYRDLSDMQILQLKSQKAELRLNSQILVNKSVESAFFEADQDAENTTNKLFRHLLNAILFVKDGRVILGPRFTKNDGPVEGVTFMGEYPSHMPTINVVITNKDVQKIITAYELISGSSKKLDKVISRALHRFMLGRVRLDFVDKLIDYVIAWESIALTQNKSPASQELIYRFSLNISSLIATINNDKKRKEYFKMMKCIYSLRSAVVHGGDDSKITKIMKNGPFKDFKEVCIFLETNFRKVIWWLINIDKNLRPYRKNEGWEDLLWP